MCHWALHSLWPTLAPYLALISPLLSWNPQCKCIFVCVRPREPERESEGVKKKERPFSLGWTLSLHPSDSFLISLIQMAASAGRHASGAWEWAPSLLLRLSHLLPSLFALLSAALPCQPIHQTHTDTLGLTYTHVCPLTVSTLPSWTLSTHTYILLHVCMSPHTLISTPTYAALTTRTYRWVQMVNSPALLFPVTPLHHCRLFFSSISSCNLVVILWILSLQSLIPKRTSVYESVALIKSSLINISQYA